MGDIIHTCAVGNDKHSRLELAASGHEYFQVAFSCWICLFRILFHNTFRSAGHGVYAAWTGRLGHCVLTASPAISRGASRHAARCAGMFLKFVMCCTCMQAKSE